MTTSTPTPAEWEHLKPYGYAPGNYMNKCSTCGQVVTDVDKRATTCRPCAEARHAALASPAPGEREALVAELRDMAAQLPLNERARKILNDAAALLAALPVPQPVEAPCKSCRGSGVEGIEQDECPICSGTGRATPPSSPVQQTPPCAMTYTPVWKEGAGGLPYQHSNFACATCGYEGRHDAHPGCRRAAAPVQQDIKGEGK